MWVYYWRLLRGVPGLLVEGVDKLAVYVTIVLSLLGLFNQRLARHVASWDGFSPWWSVVPVVLLVGYEMLKANYKHIEGLEEQATRRQIRQTLSQLGQRLVEMKSNLLLGSITEPEIDRQQELLIAWLTEFNEYARANVPELTLFASNFDFEVRKRYEGPERRSRLLALINHLLDSITRVMDKWLGSP
jgi:hypothetical protein